MLDRHRVEGGMVRYPGEKAIATVWAAAASLGERLTDAEYPAPGSIISRQRGPYGPA